MILVFGKSGQIGNELQSFENVHALDRSEADLSVPLACYDVVRKYRPEAVINAAAYTNVDAAEDENILANQINGKSPGKIAQACAELNIPLVHISTDYVFDGSGQDPWQVFAKPNPINCYGESKLMGEKKNPRVWVYTRNFEDFMGCFFTSS